LVEIEDKDPNNEDGVVRLLMDFLEIPTESEQRQKKIVNWKLNNLNKKERENIEIIDHVAY
jgi:hypothetical protein